MTRAERKERKERNRKYSVHKLIEECVRWWGINFNKEEANQVRKRLKSHKFKDPTKPLDFASDHLFKLRCKECGEVVLFGTPIYYRTRISKELRDYKLEAMRENSMKCNEYIIRKII
jgi:hypothetical protein